MVRPGNGASVWNFTGSVVRRATHPLCAYRLPPAAGPFILTTCIPATVLCRSTHDLPVPGTAPARLRRDAPARCLVGTAHRRGRCSRRIRRIRDVGGNPGRVLHVRAVPVAVLLARAVRTFPARMVRPEAGLAA